MYNMLCEKNGLDDIRLPVYMRISKRYGEEVLDESNVFLTAFETQADELRKKSNQFDVWLDEEQSTHSEQSLVQQDNLISPNIKNEDLDFSKNFEFKWFHCTDNDVLRSNEECLSDNVQNHQKNKNSSFSQEQSSKCNSKLAWYLNNKQGNSGESKSKSNSLAAKVDFNLQEILKKERKKVKNRIAASKCRKKRLEREVHLSTQVLHLQNQQMNLIALTNSLRKQVNIFKNIIKQHIEAGCHIAL